jgi:hypothetical protein
MSPYRSDERVLAAHRLEREELAALARDARARRRRAGAALGILFVGSMAGVVTLPGGSHRPMLHCHHVELRYEQASGTPPPPAGWTTCVWR